MERAKAIELAQALLKEPACCSNLSSGAVALALYVLNIEEDASPSSSSCGGEELALPAAPAHAPVSTESVAVSPARNLGGPSGHTHSFGPRGRLTCVCGVTPEEMAPVTPKRET